ncbi:MAG: FHA domain-containing protein [Fusobacteriaceae bacterium]
MKLERCSNGHMFNTARYKECPYCNSERLEEIEEADYRAMDAVENDDDKTVTYWANELAIEPVVGWLVCIEGHDKGKDYKIKTEKNFVGRAPDMDIIIEGDSNISRKNHAIITYNPKQRMFMIIPGDGNGIVYVQNNAVYAPIRLEPFNVIEMGTSRFVFVALCGEEYDWKIDK